MPVTFALVATIAREADETPANIRTNLIVSGSQVLMRMRRNLSINELWRSDDRGVLWSFFDMISTGQQDPAHLVSHAGFWWCYLLGQEFRRTPVANPGAGGFLLTPMNFTAPHEDYAEAAGGLYVKRGPTDALLGPVALAGEPPATPSVGNTGTAGGAVVSIPGAPNDILNLTTDLNIRRVRVSPFSVLQTVLLAGSNDLAGQPFSNLAALSATEYWASTDQDVEPSRSWRSTDGGASYTAHNLEANFWIDVPGVTAERRKGFISQFFLIGTQQYAFVKYRDIGGNPAQDQRNAKLARFDAGAGVWRVESNLISDGFQVVHAGAQTGVASTDAYVVTYDPAGDTARVYRTEIVGGISPGILGGSSGRSYLGGRRPRRRGVL